MAARSALRGVVLALLALAVPAYARRLGEEPSAKDLPSPPPSYGVGWDGFLATMAAMVPPPSPAQVDVLTLVEVVSSNITAAAEAIESGLTSGDYSTATTVTAYLEDAARIDCGRTGEAVQEAAHLAVRENVTRAFSKGVADAATTASGSECLVAAYEAANGILEAASSVQEERGADDEQ